VTDPTRPTDPARTPDESEEEFAAAEELEDELEADEEEEEAEEVEPPRDEVEAAAAELTASGMGDQIAAGELEPAPAPIPPDRRGRSGLRGRTQVAAATTTAAPAETLPYVDDRVSKVWVVLIALAFAALFFNALFLGQGGFLTATPSPSPSPSVTVPPSPGESPSPVPS
jgi:hypothetical protein